jgi:flagellar hook-associated protein 2
MGGLRLQGISSGLDVDGLVRQLMTLERRPVTQLEKKRDSLTSEANAWRDINSRLITLKSRASELLRTTGVFGAMRVQVSDTTVVRATVGNGAAAGVYNVTVNALATATSYKSTAEDISDPAASLGVSGEIELVNTSDSVVRGTITVSATDSLTRIAANINSNSQLKVRASVVQTEPGLFRLVLVGKESGAVNHFDFNVISGNAWSRLGFMEPGRPDLIQTGENASITVNGLTIASPSNSIEGAVPGVTLTMLKAGASTTVDLREDPDKAASAIRALVEQYNSVQEFMATQTRTATGQPGPLAGEGTLFVLQSSLRSKMVDPVEITGSEFRTLASIGIETEKFSVGGRISGKLEINETKLREALEQDPEAVKNLFQSNGTVQGVARRLDSWLADYTRSNGLLLTRAKSIDDSVNQVKERIRYYDEVILPKRERTMRTRFDTLEKALSTLQGQGLWLSQQLRSLNGFTNNR